MRWQNLTLKKRWDLQTSKSMKFSVKICNLITIEIPSLSFNSAEINCLNMSGKMHKNIVGRKFYINYCAPCHLKISIIAMYRKGGLESIWFAQENCKIAWKQTVSEKVSKYGELPLLVVNKSNQFLLWTDRISQFTKYSAYFKKQRFDGRKSRT